jgi:serine/threonine protein kinase
MNPDLAPDTTIDGRYVLREQVGSGGAGTVWKARHTSLDAVVAIKFLDDIRRVA